MRTKHHETQRGEPDGPGTVKEALHRRVDQPFFVLDGLKPRLAESGAFEESDELFDSCDSH